MTDQDRLLKNYHVSDLVWAKKALAHTLETISLNELLVKRGMWNTLISHMMCEEELDTYSAFVVGLKDLYEVVRKKAA